MAVGKQYLISFIASVHGQQVVVSGLQQMQMGLAGVTAGTQMAAAATVTYGQSMMVLAKRALMVVPIWMAMRVVFQAVFGTIGLMIKATLDLEDGMARIQTVVHGTGTEIAGQMAQIKLAITKMGQKTSVSLKELAEVFYFLKTASLSSSEAMALFEPTVSLMVATGNAAQQTARGMAGAFNTAKESLIGYNTEVEQANRIADVLAYTYATQDVQMKELIGGYERLAPYTTGLSDSFGEIVTIIGVLNTHLLRGSRTGRLLGRTILQLTKNTKPLAEAFGIAFDPDKPISLRKTLEAIAATMESTVKMTARQQALMQKVFATRGQIAPRLLIPAMEDLQEAFEGVTDSADGYVKKMEELRMATTRAQWARLKNNIGLTGIAFQDGSQSVGLWVDELTALNTISVAVQKDFQALGTAIGYSVTNMTNMVRLIKSLEMAFNNLMASKDMGKFLADLKNIEEADLMPMSWEQWIKKGTEATAKAHKEAELRKQLGIDETPESKRKEDKQRLTNLKEEQNIIKYNVALMKQLGVSALEIAQYKLEALESERMFMKDGEDIIEQEKRKMDIIEQQLKFKQMMVNNLQKVEISYLKIIGASQLQILQYEKEQINAESQKIGKVATLEALYNNHLQTVLATTKQMQKQKQLLSSFVKIYEKADGTQKAWLDRFQQIRKRKPEEIVNIYKAGGLDRQILDKWGNLLEQKAQDALIKYKAAVYNIKDFGVGGEEAVIPKDFQKSFAFEIPRTFWNNWLVDSKKAIEQFREQFGLTGAFGLPSSVKPAGQPKISKAEQAKITDELTMAVNLVVQELEYLREQSEEQSDKANAEEKKTQEILKKGLGTA